MCEYKYILSARRKLEVDVKVGKNVRHLPDREHSHLPGRDVEHSHKTTKLRPSKCRFLQAQLFR